MKKDNPLLWTIKDLTAGSLAYQVQQFVIERIQNGEIKYGVKLPSIRDFAELNHLDMNVMRMAYNKLNNLGWVKATLGSGTFVSKNINENDGLIATNSFVECLPIKIASKRDSLCNLPPAQSFISIGMDNLSPFYYPETAMFEYMRRHRKRYEHITQFEQVTDYHGLLYKETIRDYFNSTRKFRLNSECMGVVLGRSESLRLVFNALSLNEGDAIINTSIQDSVLDHRFNTPGIKVYTLDTLDPDFIDRLEELLKVTKIRVLYLRPQCGYPKCNVLDEQTCRKVIELAKKHRFYIIEEDDYHEFWYKMKPYEPLANYDHDGHVIYLGALSQLSPYMLNTRVVAAAKEFIDLLELTPIKAGEFRDVIQEGAIIDMIKNCDLWEYVKKAKRAKEADRDNLFWELDNYLGASIKINKPDSGLAFWLKFPNNSKLDDAMGYLRDREIDVPFNPNVSSDNLEVFDMRLGFGTYNDIEAGNAAKRLSDMFKGL